MTPFKSERVAGWAAQWLWPLIVVALSAGTLAVALTGAKTTLGAIVVIAFLLVGPGMPYVRLIEARGAAVEIALAVALSLALGLVVATSLAYARWWSPELGVALLVLVALAGVAAEVSAGRRLSRNRSRAEDGPAGDARPSG